MKMKQKKIRKIGISYVSFCLLLDIACCRLFHRLAAQKTFILCILPGCGLSIGHGILVVAHNGSPSIGR